MNDRRVHLGLAISPRFGMMPPSMNMKMKLAITLSAFGLLLAGLPVVAQEPPPPENKWDISKIDVSKLPPAADKKDLTYDADIAPILKASCVRCHGERQPKKNLRLDSLDAVLKGGRDGKMVVPGDSKNSLLVAAAARIDDKIAMPPKRGPRRGPGGPGGPPPGPPPGGPDAGPGGGPGPGPGGDGGGPGGPGGGPGGPGRGGPPPPPLTAEQVGLLRAWIDQGAK
ncbi:MAG TPA: c-type cytochrome domain-containing protein [Candidatus Cybelea sp.]|nr:c-type cytochrome domain-containing protein [Candidatus Cybelea sp.]